MQAQNADFAVPVLASQASGLTLDLLIQEQVKRFPDAIALQQGNTQVTYNELWDRTGRLCNWLLSKGVKRQDRIAILSENRIEYIELIVAALRIGAIVACQNWRLADEELHHCISLVTPKVIFVSKRYVSRNLSLSGTTIFVELDSEYEAVLQASSPDVAAQSCDPEDGLLILYTSGTTGLPKGALISQRAELARANVQLINFPVTNKDAFVAWAPLFHMVSTDTVLMTLMIGGKVIVTDGYNANELAQIVGSERLGRLTLMPGVISSFIEAIKLNKIKPVGVKWAGVMADLVPRAQIAELSQLMQAPYINSFGSTETGFPPGSGGYVPVGVVPEHLNKQQSALCVIKLVDNNDNEVPQGSPGEVAIKSPALFSGYWGNDNANNEDFRNGWFHMGDVMVRNKDGTLTFVDRKKYLIKSGGENIYPAEIEQVLLSDKRVIDAVVVRKQDSQWGEIPVALVVSSDESLSADYLIEMCKSRIASYKAPREIRFVDIDSLPRSATGKIMRQILEERIAQS